MAAEAGDLGITKGQLAAWITEGADPGFDGLPIFQNELLPQYKVSQEGIKKEGTQLKCNVVFLSFLTLVAAAGATWVFLTQGQPGVDAAVCLSLISVGFVIATVVTVILAQHKKKDFEHQFEKQIDECVPLKTILRAMEDPEVTPATIQTITTRLEESKRKAFICEAYAVYGQPQALSPRQEKVFKALMVNPEASELVSDRSLALKLLTYHDPNSAVSVDVLVRAIGMPLSVEEVNLIMQHPVAVKAHVESLSEAEARTYRMAVLEHIAVDAPHVVTFLTPPDSQEEAITYAHHPQAVEAYAKEQQKDRVFALRMLRFLPKDCQPALLSKLMKLARTPQTGDGLKIFNIHPIAFSKILSEDPAFVRSYLQIANTEAKTSAHIPTDGIEAPKNPDEIASFAQQPKVLAKMALQSPIWFNSSIVFSVFSTMQIAQQIEFLEGLNTHNPQCTAIVDFIMEQLLVENYVNRYETVEESIFPVPLKKLFNQFGRWPLLVTKHFFEKNFGTNKSLLQQKIFAKTFFLSMSEPDRERYVMMAADCLAKQSNAPVVCTHWLAEKPFQEWLTPILSISPSLVAHALCSIESKTAIKRCKLIVSKMSLDNLETYEHKLMEHFLVHYQKMVFNERKVSPSLTARLIERLTYLLKIPEWAQKFPEMAKRYIQLFVNADLKNKALENELMAKHKALFELYTVSFNGHHEQVPACHLAALSSTFFAKHLHSGMHGKGEKCILLDDPQIASLDTDPSKPKIAETFIHYLKTGELIGLNENNMLALSDLAHHYEMGHLSSLITLQIQPLINLDTFKVILESAVENQLWEVMTLCLSFISDNHKDQAVQTYAHNPIHNHPQANPLIRQALHCGLNAAKLGITFFYKRPDAGVQETARFGKLVSIPMGKRQVHLSRAMKLDSLQEINELVCPTVWSTAKGVDALKMALESDHVLKDQMANRWIPIFLQCAEEGFKPEDVLRFDVETAALLYGWACQYRNEKLATALFLHIKDTMQMKDLPILLHAAHKHQLKDLKLILTIFISQNHTHGDMPSLKDKFDFKGIKGMNSPISAEILRTIETGIEFGKQEMELTYHPSGEIHVLLKHFDAVNRDTVLSLLRELHQIKPITHLQGKDHRIFNFIQLETQFLGKIDRSQAPIP